MAGFGSRTSDVGRRKDRRAPAAALLGALALLLTLSTAAVPARAQDVYTATGIAVDVSGDVAGLREQALKQARREALRNVLAQIAEPAALAGLPLPNDAEIEGWVSDFEIEQEKIAADRYIGRFTFRFAAEPVQDFLAENGIAFAAGVVHPVLIVPVYREAGGAALLWEPDNPWLAAWQAAPGQSQTVPLTVPSGDAADRAALSADQALAGDPARLSALGRRYGAGAVVVAVAEAGAPLGAPGTALSLALLPAGFGQPEAPPLTVTAPSDGGDAGLFAQAIAAVRQAVAAQWREGGLVDAGRRDSLAVAAPLDSLEEWIAIKRGLARVPLLKGVDLKELSRREARLELTYVGSEAQLAQALAGAGLALETAGGGAATLSLAPGARPSLP